MKFNRLHTERREAELSYFFPVASSLPIRSKLRPMFVAALATFHFYNRRKGRRTTFMCAKSGVDENRVLQPPQLHLREDILSRLLQLFSGAEVPGLEALTVQV